MPAELAICATTFFPPSPEPFFTAARKMRIQFALYKGHQKTYLSLKAIFERAEKALHVLTTHTGPGSERQLAADFFYLTVSAPREELGFPRGTPILAIQETA